MEPVIPLHQGNVQSEPNSGMICAEVAGRREGSTEGQRGSGGVQWRWKSEKLQKQEEGVGLCETHRAADRYLWTLSFCPLAEAGLCPQGPAGTVSPFSSLSFLGQAL